MKFLEGGGSAVDFVPLEGLLPKKKSPSEGQGSPPAQRRTALLVDELRAASSPGGRPKSKRQAKQDGRNRHGRPARAQPRKGVMVFSDSSRAAGAKRPLAGSGGATGGAAAKARTGWGAPIRKHAGSDSGSATGGANARHKGVGSGSATGGSGGGTGGWRQGGTLVSSQGVQSKLSEKHPRQAVGRAHDEG